MQGSEICTVLLLTVHTNIFLVVYPFHLYYPCESNLSNLCITLKLGATHNGLEYYKLVDSFIYCLKTA